MKSNKEENSYEIGYGKPPKDSCFRKGVSGNPSGRPRGSKNKKPSDIRVRDILMEEAKREVSINVGGEMVRMSMLRAAIRSTAIKAAQGNAVAQKNLLRAMEEAEEKIAREKQAIFESAFIYKQNLSWEVESREARGLSIDDILPHPDHIDCDVMKGEVIFRGPLDKRQKAEWDKIWYLKRSEEENVADFQEDMLNPGCGEYKDEIEGWLVRSRHFLDFLDYVLVSGWNVLPGEVTSDISRQKMLKNHVEQGTCPKRPGRR